MFVSSHAVQPDGTGLAIAGVEDQRTNAPGTPVRINESTYHDVSRIYSNKTAT